MFFFILRVVLALSAVAHASPAIPTSTSTSTVTGAAGNIVAPTPAAGIISTCVRACIHNVAINNGCNDADDRTCVCTNKNFQQAAIACLQSHCTPAEQQEAKEIQNAKCFAVDKHIPPVTQRGGSHSLSAACSQAEAGFGFIAAAFFSIIGLAL